jgi:hypothetical protein
MMASGATSRWLLMLRFALVVYLLLGALMIRQKPGLQYDEALHVIGAVHMRHLPHEELTLPHDPDTWVPVFGRWFPLMTLRYTGAVKDYLCWPLFAQFGTRTSLVRMVSLMLGAIGIWGMAALIRRQVSVSAAAFFAVLLAINPSYVAATVFDNSAVGIVMASLGLCCLAISSYLDRGTPAAAFAVGFALGFAIWARANTAWVEGAFFIAVFLVLARRALAPLSHWIAAAIGGIAGGFPFLVYQIVSRGGTWEALSIFARQDSLHDRLLTRLVMFSETLLIDREHRAMWNGAPLPDWQRWLFPALVLASCLACIIGHAVWPRVIAIAFLISGAILFFSRVAVSEHHLVVLVPLAAAMTVFAGSAAPARFRAIPMAFFAVYVGCALYWQGAAIRGLRATGGVGMWSDALLPLGERLEERYPSREIKILDWGLQNNLYVVTDARLHTREIFWDAKRPWTEEIREGGVFVMNGAGNRQLPAATEGFLAAFEEGRPHAQRTVISQRSGAPYAEIFEIAPNTLHIGPVSSLKTGDASRSDQLEGFHQIESGGWRWTRKEFEITLGSPTLAPRAEARLAVELFIPETQIQNLGPITISARVNRFPLKPEMYSQSGTYTFTRDLQPAMLADSNRVEFSLDKATAPSAADGRELGIVVVSASILATK